MRVMNIHTATHHGPWLAPIVVHTPGDADCEPCDLSFKNNELLTNHTGTYHMVSSPDIRLLNDEQTIFSFRQSITITEEWGTPLTSGYIFSSYSSNFRILFFHLRSRKSTLILKILSILSNSFCTSRLFSFLIII
jgi:hypothetical protein